jgi:hypothetical protein
MTSETTQQTPPEAAQPQNEHRWLQRLVGEWTIESEASMAPDQPAMKTTGTETVRALGDLWIVGEGTSQMPDGATYNSILTLGYDPDKKRFVGTWIGSVMTYLWLYDGKLEGNTLTLDCEGPSMAGDGSMAKYQDIIEMASDDHRIMRSRMFGDDGKGEIFMTAHYRRVR